jgi:hypothetical protein
MRRALVRVQRARVAVTVPRTPVGQNPLLEYEKVPAATTRPSPHSASSGGAPSPHSCGLMYEQRKPSGQGESRTGRSSGHSASNRPSV